MRMSAIAKPSRKVVRSLRSIIAFVVAPLVPGLLAALPDLLRGDPMARWYIEFAAKAGYPIIVTLGVPIYFLLKRWGRTGLPNYLVTGVIWGAAAYLSAFLPGLFLSDAGVSQAMAVTWMYLPISTISGVIAAVAFWLIVRPDR
jgi:hypothetical protein